MTTTEIDTKIEHSPAPHASLSPEMLPETSAEIIQGEVDLAVDRTARANEGLKPCLPVGVGRMDTVELHETMQQYDISVKDIAELADVAYSTAARWKSGDTRPPKWFRKAFQAWLNSKGISKEAQIKSGEACPLIPDGGLINALRDCGLSRTDLMYRTGTNYTQVTRWINGTSKIPDWMHHWILVDKCQTAVPEDWVAAHTRAQATARQATYRYRARLKAERDAASNTLTKQEEK